MNNAGKYVIGGIAGLFMGGLLGHLMTKHALAKNYDEMLAFEVEKLKEFYEIRATGMANHEDEAPREVNSEWIREQNEQKKKLLKELMEDNQYVEEVSAEDPKADAEQIQSIWNSEDRQKWEEEAKASPRRHPDDDIFIISFQEFQYEEENYDKISVQYFEGDDTLCDENDQPIPQLEERIGHDFTNWFGWESGSPLIVHVRNKKLEMDFEVARNDGSYTNVVLGLPDEDEFEKRPKKMRDDD